MWTPIMMSSSRYNRQPFNRLCGGVYGECLIVSVVIELLEVY